MPIRSAQAVVDALPDGIVLAGPDGRVTLISQVAVDMLGAPGGCVGEPVTDVLGVRDQHANGWVTTTRPSAGLTTRTAIPAQSWLRRDGTEVLVPATIHRPTLHQP